MPMNRRSFRVSIRCLAILVAAVVAASVAPALAQSGGAEDTKSLRAKVEASRKALEQTERQIRNTMELYNSLIQQKAKKPDGVYKKLSSSVDACDKSAKATGKSVQAMHKDMQKVFEAWSKEIDTYSAEDLKTAARKSYDEAKGRLDRFDRAMSEASELYQPFIEDLREQTQFMGRDLSPEGMAALAEPAKKLNEKAEALFAKIDQALNDTREAGPEADVAAEHSATADDEAAGEKEGSEEPD